MILNINIDNEAYELEVPQQLIDEAEDFFSVMDKDMDKGWQMGRFWVEKPDTFQRCQVAADKIVGAMHKEDKRMFYLMSAYIVKNMPDVKMVKIDTSAEIDEIDIMT